MTHAKEHRFPQVGHSHYLWQKKIVFFLALLEKIVFLQPNSVPNGVMAALLTLDQSV